MFVSTATNDGIDSKKNYVSDENDKISKEAYRVQKVCLMIILV